MKNENSKLKLFAIYKKGNHLGNEHGKDVDDAIKNYIIASLFEGFLDDPQFVSLYSGKLAIKGIHYL